mgnify:CR=1 FL=1
MMFTECDHVEHHNGQSYPCSERPSFVYEGILYYIIHDRFEILIYRMVSYSVLRVWPIHLGISSDPESIARDVPVDRQLPTCVTDTCLLYNKNYAGFTLAEFLNRILDTDQPCRLD